MFDEQIFRLIKGKFYKDVMDHQLTTLRELAEMPFEQVLEKRMLQDNLLKLNIYTDSVKGHMVSETFAYPFMSFLSEVGGIMGLYLGTSVAYI